MLELRLSGGELEQPRYTNVWVTGVRKNAGSNQLDVVASAGGAVFVPPLTELFGYDADGNLTNDGRFAYTWDGENRLVKVETLPGPVAAGAPNQKLLFGYDHQSRRIRKQVFVWDTDHWSLVTDHRFVYDGWNLLAEVGTTGSVVRSYVWGLDLSGSEQGAGGIGGLLWVNLPQAANPQARGSHFVAFDGNGNVVGLVDMTGGALSASYEYGPFGELIRSTGPVAKANPIRFSTKYQDDATGLLYYGYRYYQPSTGRWLSRDPMEEKGGPNLYGFVRNDPENLFDSLGLIDWGKPGAIPGTPTVNGMYYPIPAWFYHPADEGKPCCCKPPGTHSWSRADSTGFLSITMGLDLKINGCYKDLTLLWTVCWHPVSTLSGTETAGVILGCVNQTSCTFSVIPWGGPYITNAWLRYLACENGKWVKHEDNLGRTFFHTWYGGWTW